MRTMRWVRQPRPTGAEGQFAFGTSCQGVTDHLAAPTVSRSMHEIWGFQTPIGWATTVSSGRIITQ